MLPRIQPAGIAAVTPIICLLFHFYYSCILIYASIEIFWLNCMAWANILLILHRYVSSAAFYPGSSEMPHRLFPYLILLYLMTNTLPCLFRIRSCYICILHTIPAIPKLHICILMPINSTSEIYHGFQSAFPFRRPIKSHKTWYCTFRQYFYRIYTRGIPPPLCWLFPFRWLSILGIPPALLGYIEQPVPVL